MRIRDTYGSKEYPGKNPTHPIPKYKQMENCTIVVAGAKGVGKTTLTNTLIYDASIDVYDPTGPPDARKIVMIDNAQILINILDVGLEEYTAIRNHLLRGGQGFVLVYSVKDRSSFDAIKFWYNKILKVNHKGWIPVVLVGNKRGCNV
ncbi:P-loop containing nucleoside triphosphate hydrolase protein [Lasiosphaeria hispida]|uniref:P-loop containing nucleoside triphosphate hydrolase protein n=1 Tax=Lasiosphaeria hispida TaxID=260671 RepID=A0AAJ0HCB7_9PEZI|nr:P-loop containing nucleoside triphosphate hydrolase protein [Lasiosphaeria hispida]